MGDGDDQTQPIYVTMAQITGMQRLGGMTSVAEVIQERLNKQQAGLKISDWPARQITTQDRARFIGCRVRTHRNARKKLRALPGQGASFPASFAKADGGSVFAVFGQGLFLLPRSDTADFDRIANHMAGRFCPWGPLGMCQGAGVVGVAGGVLYVAVGYMLFPT